MQKNLLKYLTLFYTATHIPFSWYKPNGDFLLSCPQIIWQTKLSQAEPAITSSASDFCLYDSTGFYSTIILPDYNGILYIGPVYSIPMNDALISSFIKANQISLSQKEAVVKFLSALPTMTFYQFVSKLNFLYYSITGRYIELSEFIDMHNSTENLVGYNTKYTRQSLNNKENSHFHNSFEWEQQLYQTIQSGDVSKLRHYISNKTPLAQLGEGHMSTSPLRQAKNIFIGAVTKAGTLAAIPGGMDVEEVYLLIDLYVQECENKCSIDDIRKMYVPMYMDFTTRIHNVKRPRNISYPLFQCMTYIHNHTHENIRVADVAQQTNKSISYISRIFREELGSTVNEYIISCKLDEAKSLLKFTELSLAEISNYLCFSSQSYFQNVFKKRYNITPMQYRKQCRTNLTSGTVNPT